MREARIRSVWTGEVGWGFAGASNQSSSSFCVLSAVRRGHWVSKEQEDVLAVWKEKPDGGLLCLCV